MIALPEREKRENETPILRQCIIALNRVPGVRASRNNNGQSPCACVVCRPRLCRSCAVRLTRPITFGQGDGSPDILCRLELFLVPTVFWVEVKTPTGRTSKERKELQRLWRVEAATRGERTAVVTSAEEAIAAAERFRGELIEAIVDAARVVGVMQAPTRPSLTPCDLPSGPLAHDGDDPA